MSDDYQHPQSGRVYRQGDPAHRFAVLTGALARQCEVFLAHYQERMGDADYLAQYGTWSSDPQRVARAISDTIDAIEGAYTAVTVDKDAYMYGLGEQDDEWHRKYGAIE